MLTVNPYSVLVTGGIGDFLCLESFLSFEEREKITCIFYATRAAAALAELMAVLPNYPNLRSQHVLSGHPNKVYYNKGGVEAEFGTVTARDLSIQTVFYEENQYFGSSFLTYRVAKIQEIDRPYVIICPFSENQQKSDRNFSPADWAACLSILERNNLTGVVLYSGENELPRHSNLLDLTNRTTLAESIEYMKSAVSYIGVDSCLSVLAAKLYPYLCVKTVNKHCLTWKHWYYAPRCEFNFLKIRVGNFHLSKTNGYKD